MMQTGDAAYDLSAAENFDVFPNSSHIVPLGVAFKIPSDMVGILTHRSSLAFKRDCTVSYGVIDSSFDSEVFAKVFNHGLAIQKFQFGERIAQIRFTLVQNTSLYPDNWEDGGKEGFGSSGRK